MRCPRRSAVRRPFRPLSTCSKEAVISNEASLESTRATSSAPSSEKRPRHCSGTLPSNADRARVEAAETFWEFDDVFTGPVHGFAGADDYYARSSSIRFLSKIRVPTLLLSAVDDPFLPPVVLDRVREVASSNAKLELEFTPRGGHVGWVAGSPWAPQYYLDSRVAGWLGAV